MRNPMLNIGYPLSINNMLTIYTSKTVVEINIKNLYSERQKGEKQDESILR